MMKYINSIDIQMVYYESIHLIVQYLRIRSSIFDEEEHSCDKNSDQFLEEISEPTLFFLFWRVNLSLI